MAYKTVGMCLSENLQTLDAAVHTPENRALWNLSNALLNMCMSMEDDLQAIKDAVAALDSKVTRLSR